MRKPILIVVLLLSFCVAVSAQEARQAALPDNYECTIYVLTSEAGQSNAKLPKSFDNVARTLRDQYQINNPRLKVAVLARITDRSKIDLGDLPFFTVANPTPSYYSFAANFRDVETNSPYLDAFRFRQRVPIAIGLPDGRSVTEFRDSGFSLSGIALSTDEPNLLIVIPDLKAGESLIFVIMLKKLQPPAIAAR